jgi:hypothetical protein
MLYLLKFCAAQATPWIEGVQLPEPFDNSNTVIWTILARRHHILREMEFPSGYPIRTLPIAGWISAGTRRSLSESEEMQK